jgi:hypothetical protein
MYIGFDFFYIGESILASMCTQFIASLASEVKLSDGETAAEWTCGKRLYPFETYLRHICSICSAALWNFLTDRLP